MESVGLLPLWHSISQSDAMYRRKYEQELRNQKDCAAEKVIDAFKNSQFIRVFVQKYRRTESCKIVNS